MLFLFIALIEYILDQSSKILIVKFLPLNESLCILKPILYLHHIHNQGGAFGLFSRWENFFVWIAAAVILVLLIFSGKIIRGNLSTQIIAGLILGGVAGNLTDRLRFGYVIDFIDIKIWPVFNVADIGLTLAILWLIIIIILDFRRQTKKRL